MIKLLIVDDEKHIREVIREYAEFEGYLVEEASDGHEAIEKCKQTDFNIIIIDVMMPKLDGFSTVKALRKTLETPILMLSARGEEYDKLFGFEMGIDDYVVKPFSPKEIMARINVILKRGKLSMKEDLSSGLMIFRGLVIDRAGHVVHVDDKRIELTPKEYELLIQLAENKNIAFSREQLLNSVWGYDYYGDDRTVDTHIKMLRNSLGDYRDLIVTIRGVGYKFEF
ncbi:response regulator transcription factor [Fusibacter sp. 3D3]|uniref:response regulator transcription factor n=1 Tax=Fusibacter sp. 3D3 TaxID=1048380 RepID=UPI000853959C|nr:response regulator transcription factor [Fusibacter sp. 3D3]